VTESLPSAESMGVLSDSVTEENQAVGRAMESSPEIKRLALEITAKEAHVKMEDAAKYPSMELIAQYGYFTRITRFETTNLNGLTPNNIQLGTSIKVPLFNKQRIAARVGEAIVPAIADGNGVARRSEARAGVGAREHGGDPGAL
jgi:outer membrane protein TolC